MAKPPLTFVPAIEVRLACTSCEVPEALLRAIEKSYFDQVQQASAVVTNQKRTVVVHVLSYRERSGVFMALSGPMAWMRSDGVGFRLDTGSGAHDYEFTSRAMLPFGQMERLAKGVAEVVLTKLTESR